jgi:hypothetical protein
MVRLLIFRLILISTDKLKFNLRVGALQNILIPRAVPLNIMIPKINQVPHRFNDFFTLHSELRTVDLNLPQLPPKGLDGSDPRVVEDRKNKLQAFLRYCLSSDVIRLENQLLLWKFLEFENAGLSMARFLMGPPLVRSNLLNTLPKLCEDPKYSADLYRLGHPDVVSLCLEQLLDMNAASSATNFEPPNLVSAAKMLIGSVKCGTPQDRLRVVSQCLNQPQFLEKVFRFFANPANFA